MPKLLDNFMLIFPKYPVDEIKFISRIDTFRYVSPQFHSRKLV